ncbi:MAG: hypothetical protein EOO73_20150 [Myxococcales bacterium]|nr:MAG: hypothetical protein EOO73_20150 [Myxococcales bacterium]
MVNRILLIVLALGGVAAGAMLLREPERATPSAPTAAAKVSASARPVATASLLSLPASVTTLHGSPEGARLASRRELYESVDALVQASEFEKARRLLDDDQARFGDDTAGPWRDFEQSYRIIADCLEHPTAQLRSRAQAFVLVSEAQVLKSRILTACGAPSSRSR